MNTAANMIDKKKFLAHWQGHRSLTRRVIEKFPEEELFTHRVGEMRPFADMVKELLSVALPGLLSTLWRIVRSLLIMTYPSRIRQNCWKNGIVKHR